MGKLLSKFGVTTQHVPYGETYTAAATGLIDGATMGGPRDYAALSLNEVCPYGIYPFMLLPWGSPLIINLDLWDELPDHLKAILEKACAEYSHWDVGSYYADEAALMPELGITWCTLPDEDWETLNNAAEEVWDEWAAENGPDAQAAIKLLKAWHEEAGGYRYKN
jgi:TRAP-type mannitol/chloroaromatic compound transport system substrate-binding protein